MKKQKKVSYKRRNSLLYKSEVEYGSWCINHVENCSHGCKFPCYAMMMAKRFGRIKSYKDWLKPILVENALEILDKEIPKYRKEIDFVHLCFMTDPFMYGHREIAEMTLKIIEKLNKNGIRVTVLTKGILPESLNNRKKYSLDNEYGITLVSGNESFRKEFEPNTADYKTRVSALKKLHNKGAKTWVSMEPYPTPNLDKKQNLEKLLESVNFVNKIIFGKLNYNVQSTKFGNNKSFYEESAEKVIDFCNKNNIEYHIKFGTHREDNKKTKEIFKNNSIKSNQYAPCLQKKLFVKN